MLDDTQQLCDMALVVGTRNRLMEVVDALSADPLSAIAAARMREALVVQPAAQAALRRLRAASPRPTDDTKAGDL